MMKPAANTPTTSELPAKKNGGDQWKKSNNEKAPNDRGVSRYGVSARDLVPLSETKTNTKTGTAPTTIEKRPLRRKYHKDPMGRD